MDSDREWGNNFFFIFFYIYFYYLDFILDKLRFTHDSTK